jgi:hypothetical protein
MWVGGIRAEVDWLTSTSPGPLLGHLGAGADQRKLRLFVCAWASDVWHLLTDSRSGDAVLVAEAFTDGTVDRAALVQAHAGAAAARDAISTCGGRLRSGGKRSRRGGWASVRAADLARVAADPALSLRSVFELLEWENVTREYAAAERVRDLFGNPFRPVTFDPRWRTSDVAGLARSIYEDRAFDRMPLLSDALMDAGCADEQVLGHCRGDGPHVRGCWVVDLVLGK